MKSSKRCECRRAAEDSSTADRTILGLASVHGTGLYLSLQCQVEYHQPPVPFLQEHARPQTSTSIRGPLHQTSRQAAPISVINPPPKSQQPTPGAGGSSVRLSFTLPQSPRPCGEQGGWDGAGAQVHPLQLLGKLPEAGAPAAARLPPDPRSPTSSCSSPCSKQTLDLLCVSDLAVCPDTGKGVHSPVKPQPQVCWVGTSCYEASWNRCPAYSQTIHQASSCSASCSVLGALQLQGCQRRRWLHPGSLLRTLTGCTQPRSSTTFHFYSMQLHG